MKTVKVLTVDLDTTEAKVKFDVIEAQLDRILDKQKQLILQADDNGNINVLGMCKGCNVNEVIKALEQLKCR